jgi:hypothetical protein
VVDRDGSNINRDVPDPGLVSLRVPVTEPLSMVILRPVHPACEQSIPHPDPVGVDHIRFGIRRDLTDTPLMDIALYLRAIDFRKASPPNQNCGQAR